MTRPPRTRRRLDPACAFLATLALAATTASASSSDLPVRVTAPTRGASLQAGSEAVVAWTADRPLPPGVDEWEAFLSLDGGATYPLRITPHLDRALSRFTWRVPDLPTENARLLLRFGNEHDEREVDSGIVLTIRRAVTGDPTALLGDRVVLHPGEAARPGQAGVIAWVEADRHGGGLRQVRTSAPRTDLFPGVRSTLPAGGDLCSEEPDPRSIARALLADLAPRILPPLPPASPRDAATRSPTPSVLLSRLQRWNV